MSSPLSSQSYAVGTNMTPKAHSGLGAFDLAAPSACNTLAPGMCLAKALTSYLHLAQISPFQR